MGASRLVVPVVLLVVDRFMGGPLGLAAAPA